LRLRADLGSKRQQQIRRGAPVASCPAPPRKPQRGQHTAALGFLRLRQQPAEVAMLRRWLDSWAGMGDVIAGLTRQGLDLELRQFPRGWRASLYPTGTAHSIVVASAWELRPWRAVQQAGWRALSAQG
jgi:hypothetical protein